MMMLIMLMSMKDEYAGLLCVDWWESQTWQFHQYARLIAAITNVQSPTLAARHRRSSPSTSSGVRIILIYLQLRVT